MTIATIKNRSSESTVILKKNSTNDGGKNYTLAALDKKKAAKMSQALRKVNKVYKKRKEDQSPEKKVIAWFNTTKPIRRTKK
ncbi:hypothetical protein GLAREA_08244 [Glarea lozoyensis ATCC 20868]|uniref:Uncharacterized protein n=1 Tax=Glarea lozoyensis (strain ATCC 20868 / MF5171) TaxID=1116229 RepID=S3CCY0_GLAL2|nr:uncharacterized protein GLAREA_08244 [Glarea lozoyensis ATCC 20868]EPE24392.1 hypothetical protein GLAREA_08244 [Glarea lozoyensis ATCC 20868]